MPAWKWTRQKGEAAPGRNLAYKAEEWAKLEKPGLRARRVKDGAGRGRACETLLPPQPQYDPLTQLTHVFP